MVQINADLFKLIRLGLGLGLERDDDSSLYLDERGWNALFTRLQEHALIGIVFAGVQKLPKTSVPTRRMLLQWFGATEQIKQRNATLDKSVVKLCKRLDDDGWLFCILKGQTVARYYPEPALRQSGDIDVWIYGRKNGSRVSRKDIINYLEQKGRKVKLCYLHADGITVDGDVSVEVHFHPSFSVCPWRNICLQSALNKLYVPNDCEINGADVPAANYEFNRLFMLHHIYRHLFSEGVGLRQIVDYAMLLTQRNDGIDHNVERQLQKLGMLKFAQGIMWILSECLNVPSKCLYTNMDEKEGRYLLNEIMRSGNFGQASDEKKPHDTKWQRFANKAKHNVSFIWKYPNEVLWYAPFSIYETIAYKIPHR